jgi:hypothetical protein
MHVLGELANTTWLRLEDLLKDLDDSDKERQAFVDDTRQFFLQRLSIYEQQRNELENHLKILSEQMDQLSDELQLPRIIFENNQMTLIEKRIFINDKIDRLKYMILERDKELIQLRQLIQIKANLIGNIQINTDEVRRLFSSLFKLDLGFLRIILNVFYSNLEKFYVFDSLIERELLVFCSHIRKNHPQD